VTGVTGIPDTHDPLRVIGGWIFLLVGIGALVISLPTDIFDAESARFFFLLGVVGAWRYSMGIIHFVRGVWFFRVMFPIHRKQALALGEDAAPPHVYLMVTSFRIEALTTAQVYRAVIEEAVNCGYPTTVVASIVEYSDENVVKALWEKLAPADHVRLRIVRVAGTGKRDGLAYGFRSISQYSPDGDALVAVVDGDSILSPGCIRRCAPYFALFPTVGALTTNEFCDVKAENHWLKDWHKLRFAQRHINMCSMALSRRVLTLTGRMSVFRASVACDAGFIDDVQNDFLEHWRLGRFRFLTGDDKSTWYSLTRRNWETYYVPDAAIRTVEHSPDPSFFRASRMLMFRWYGNSLRQNLRAGKLGPTKLGFFAWYVLMDQRIAMWTMLLGPLLAIAGALKYSGIVIILYALWIMLTRTILSALLLVSGHGVAPTFPVLLYYNQIVGSMTKIGVLFNIDKQTWTRQKTRAERDLDPWQHNFNSWSSRLMLLSSATAFVAAVLAVA
jgi:glycosyltransferase Alg8